LVTVHKQPPPSSTGEQGILDAFETPVFAVDRSFRYTAFNEEHAAVMRRAYGAEIEIGGNALAYPSIPLDGELVATSLERALNGGTVVSRAWVGPKSDRRFYLTTHSPILDGHEVVGIAMISADMTQEERAREADARLAAIIKCSDDAILTTSPDGVIMTWNPGATKLYGYSEQEAIGQPWGPLVFTDERDRIQEALTEVNHGEAAARFVATGLRKDGQRVDVSIGVAALRDADGVIVGASSIAHDITRRKLTEERLARKVRALRALNRVNEALVKADAEDELLAAICQIIVSDGGYRVAWVGYRQDDEAHSVLPVATSGVEVDYLNELHRSWSEGPTEAPGGRAIREARPVLIRDVASEPSLGEWREQAAAQGIRSALALPLLDADGTAFGAVSIGSLESDSFDEDELALLREMSDDLSYGIRTLRARLRHEERGRELEMANDRLEALLKSVTETMGRIVETRDPYTQGHQTRVAGLVALICEKMDIPAFDAEGIELAALVHDIGKLSVPAEILTKPGKISEIELLLIKGHSQTGYDILQHIDFGWPIADIVLQHHERLDGSGYPNGLTSQDISTAARIIMAADVIEAMASNRPYRAALGLEMAIDEVRDHPEQFDAAVASACVELYEEGRLDL
jgi:PAS domain S-box-containing protein/putative nucleotidyltransferase with HDIG domain